MMSPTKPLAIQDATYFDMPMADMQNWIIVMGGVFTMGILCQHWKIELVAFEVEKELSKNKHRVKRVKI
jgi:hypothetical protein